MCASKDAKCLATVTAKSYFLDLILPSDNTAADKALVVVDFVKGQQSNVMTTTSTSRS